MKKNRCPNCEADLHECGILSMNNMLIVCQVGLDSQGELEFIPLNTGELDDYEPEYLCGECEEKLNLTDEDILDVLRKGDK